MATIVNVISMVAPTCMHPSLCCHYCACKFLIKVGCRNCNSESWKIALFGSWKSEVGMAQTCHSRNPISRSNNLITNKWLLTDTKVYNHRVYKEWNASHGNDIGKDLCPKVDSHSVETTDVLMPKVRKMISLTMQITTSKI